MCECSHVCTWMEGVTLDRGGQFHSITPTVLGDEEEHPHGVRKEEWGFPAAQPPVNPSDAPSQNLNEEAPEQGRGS